MGSSAKCASTSLSSLLSAAAPPKLHSLAPTATPTCEARSAGGTPQNWSTCQRRPRSVRSARSCSTAPGPRARLAALPAAVHRAALLFLARVCLGRKAHRRSPRAGRWLIARPRVSAELLAPGSGFACHQPIYRVRARVGARARHTQGKTARSRTAPACLTACRSWRSRDG